MAFITVSDDSSPLCSHCVRTLTATPRKERQFTIHVNPVVKKIAAYLENFGKKNGLDQFAFGIHSAKAFLQWADKLKGKGFCWKDFSRLAPELTLQRGSQISLAYDNALLYD